MPGRSETATPAGFSSRSRCRADRRWASGLNNPLLRRFPENCSNLWEIGRSAIFPSSQRVITYLADQDSAAERRYNYSHGRQPVGRIWQLVISPSGAAQRTLPLCRPAGAAISDMINHGLTPVAKIVSLASRAHGYCHRKSICNFESPFLVSQVSYYPTLGGVARRSFISRAGVVPREPPRLRQLRWLRDIPLMAQPPLLTQEGSFHSDASRSLCLPPEVPQSGCLNCHSGPEFLSVIRRYWAIMPFQIKRIR